VAGSSKIGGFKPAVLLTVVMAVGWVLCFFPARQFSGEAGIWWMSLAAGCCLVPGWIVVFLSGLAIFPNELSAMLVQTMLRLGVVSVVAISVKMLRPDVGAREFFGWLIGFYLLALATEVVLLRSKPSRARSGPRE
jgi:hypothetical protein